MKKVYRRGVYIIVSSVRRASLPSARSFVGTEAKIMVFQVCLLSSLTFFLMVRFLGAMECGADQVDHGFGKWYYSYLGM